MPRRYAPGNFVRNRSWRNRLALLHSHKTPLFFLIPDDRQDARGGRTGGQPDLLDLEKVDLNRRRSAKDADHHPKLALLLVHFFDLSGERIERTFHNANALADS